MQLAAIRKIASCKRKPFSGFDFERLEIASDSHLVSRILAYFCICTVDNTKSWLSGFCPCLLSSAKRLGGKMKFCILLAAFLAAPIAAIAQPADQPNSNPNPSTNRYVAVAG